MILFDVGGTLFIDGKCIPRDGLTELRKLAENPDITDDNTLSALWDEYMDEVDVGLYSKNGAVLDIPLSAVLKYIIMKSGLRINLPMYDIEEIFDRYNSSRAVAEGLTSLLDVVNWSTLNFAVSADYSCFLSKNCLSVDCSHTEECDNPHPEDSTGTTHEDSTAGTYDITCTNLSCNSCCKSLK